MCLKYIFWSPQGCVCCARTLLNACFPLFAPPTTTSPVSRAWWRGCVRLWAPHYVSWIRLLTTAFLPFLHLQVQYSFSTDLHPCLKSFKHISVTTVSGPWVSWVLNDIHPFIFAFGSVVENPPERPWSVSLPAQKYFQLQSCCRIERNILTTNHWWFSDSNPHLTWVWLLPMKYFYYD